MHTPVFPVTSITLLYKSDGLYFSAAQAPLSLTSEALSSVPHTPITYNFQNIINCGRRYGG